MDQTPATALASSTGSAEEFLSSSGGSRFDFVALMTFVLRRKGFILLVGFALALLAALVSLAMKPMYRATTMMLPPQVARAGAAALLSSGISSEMISGGGLSALSQAKPQTDMFVVMLSAWPVQDALVKAQNLVDVYKVRDAKAARKILAANTTVVGSKEGFISVTVSDRDKQRCAAIANGYVDAMREFLRGLALTDAAQRRIFYESQLAKTKDDLAKAEVAFKQMEISSGMVSLDSQAKTLLEGAASLRSQITAKEVELESLRGYSTESNPQVQITESEIAALRGQLSQLESRDQGGYTGKSLSSVPGAELSFVRATRELKYQENLYELLVRQANAAEIDEARDAPIVQVIEPALPPDIRYKPQRTKMVLAAFGVGLFLATLYVMVRYFLSQMSDGLRERMRELRRAALRWN